MTTVSLHGKRLRPVRTSAASVISGDTVFEFVQEGHVVFARYAGGRIVCGALVGILNGASLTFRYAQADRDGNLQGGRSECDVVTVDGRVQIEERFTFAGAESGVNVLETIE